MPNAQQREQVQFLFVSCNGSTKKLSDVLYVPEIKRNLLSVAAITDRNLKVQFDKAGAVITDANNTIVGRGIRRNNLYELSAFTAELKRMWGQASYGMKDLVTLAMSS